MMKSENREVLREFIARVRREFGTGLGEAILRVFFEELGGMRITVPSIKELALADRDRRILLAFNGDNHAELAERWGLSVRHIRRIVNGT